MTIARGLLTATAVTAVVTASPLAGVQQPQQASAAFPVPATVRVVRDVVYAEYGSRQLKLDIYRPPDSTAKRLVPGVIAVRGGNWQGGAKETYGFIAGNIANAGFVAVSIEYRASGEAKFPAAVHDVKAAVRWMRANAATYGIDPRAIGAVGGSAGAHLVALVGTSAGVKDLEGSGGHAAASSEVQAVVAMACPCNLLRASRTADDTPLARFIGSPLQSHLDVLKAASPVTYVSRRSPPLLLMHSQTDPAVAFERSVEIEDLYEQAGAPVSLKIIDALDVHAFWNQTRFFPETLAHTVEFLRKYLATTAGRAR